MKTATRTRPTIPRLLDVLAVITFGIAGAMAWRANASVATTESLWPIGATLVAAASTLGLGFVSLLMAQRMRRGQS